MSEFIGTRIYSAGLFVNVTLYGLAWLGLAWGVHDFDFVALWREKIWFL
jgi:hypothetical protein